MPSVPRNAWNSRVRTWRPWRHAPMQPSWSHTALRGTAPNWPQHLQHPAQHVVRRRGTGSSSAPRNRENPQHAHDAPTACRPGHDRAGSSTSGCHRSNWASSPGR